MGKLETNLDGLLMPQVRAQPCTVIVVSRVFVQSLREELVNELFQQRRRRFAELSDVAGDAHALVLRPIHIEHRWPAYDGTCDVPTIFVP